MAVNLLDPTKNTDPNAYMQQSANTNPNTISLNNTASVLPTSLGTTSSLGGPNLGAALTTSLPGAAPGASAPTEGSDKNPTTANIPASATGIQQGVAAPLVAPGSTSPVDPTVLANTKIAEFAFNPDYAGIENANIGKFAGYDTERKSAKGIADKNWGDARSEADRLKDIAIQKLMDRLGSQGMGMSSVALDETKNLMGNYNNQLQGIDNIHSIGLNAADTNWVKQYGDLNTTRGGLFAQQGKEVADAAKEAARVKAQGEADAAQALRDQTTQDILRNAVQTPPAAPTPLSDPSAIYGINNGAGGQQMVNHDNYINWINQVAPNQASFNQLGNVFVGDKGLAPDIHDAIGRRLFGMYGQSPDLGKNVPGSPGFNYGTGDPTVPLAPWMDPRFGGRTPQVPGLPV